MRFDEAFVLGAVTGAVVVWLSGQRIANVLGETTREVRTNEEAVRPV